jgi:hypothetical protein
MPIHSVEPRRDPAAAGLQKSDAQFRVPLDDAAPDHREAGQHHFHCVRDDVARAAPFETVDADLRHAAAGAFVETDREIEVLGRRPEQLVHRVVDHLAAAVWVRPDEAALEAQLLRGEAHLGDRQIDRLQGQHRDAEQPVGVGLAVIGEPAVVGAAGRGRQFGILDRAGEEAQRRIEKRGIDAVRIHVGDAGMRIEAALAALPVLHRIGRDDALAGANSAGAAEPGLGAAEHLLLDDEPLLAVRVFDQPQRPIAEARVHVMVP